VAKQGPARPFPRRGEAKATPHWEEKEKGGLNLCILTGGRRKRGKIHWTCAVRGSSELPTKKIIVFAGQKKSSREWTKEERKKGKGTSIKIWQTVPTLKEGENSPFLLGGEDSNVVKP